MGTGVGQSETVSVGQRRFLWGEVEIGKCDMWFALWSRIPDRSRRYGSQYPGLSRRWESAKQEIRVQAKGETHFPRGKWNAGLKRR